MILLFHVQTGFSRLNYTPTTDLDYGTISCWAKNAIGAQRSPCTFQIVAAGKRNRSKMHIVFTLESMAERAVWPEFLVNFSGRRQRTTRADDTFILNSELLAIIHMARVEMMWKAILPARTHRQRKWPEITTSLQSYHSRDNNSYLSQCNCRYMIRIAGFYSSPPPPLISCNAHRKICRITNFQY